jgi:hypothetical protein
MAEEPHEFELDDAGYAKINVPGEISEERWRTHFTDDNDEWLPPSADDIEAVLGLNGGGMDRIATELERRAGDSGADVASLAERKDLEPGTVAALKPLLGDWVQSDRKVDVPHWPGVGRTDLVVLNGETTQTLAWLAELKWCGPGRDVLYEGIWDLFKMALTTTREDHPRAYLLTGAERSLWETSGFGDLFDDATHDPVELCARRLPDKKGTLAWDDALRGGYDSFPDQLPARIGTTVAGRASVGDWELRAVQVNVIGENWITMDGGWPKDNRPEGARHPAAA